MIASLRQNRLKVVQIRFSKPGINMSMRDATFGNNIVELKKMLCINNDLLLLFLKLSYCILVN